MQSSIPQSNESLVAQYIATVVDKLKTGQAREHAYRPAFESLIKSIDPSLQVVNDPSRSEHGNPDFVFLRGDITSGYAETKDIGVDLNKTEKTQQMERYLGYSNLILTDYLEFRFFRNGERYEEPIIVGKIIDGTVEIHEKNFGALADTLKDFLQGEPEPIKSGRRLAKIMGGKARRIRDNVVQFLGRDSKQNNELEQVYKAIKEMLVHDLSKESFADMYAQTLVYGLFVARFHDDTPGDFTRQEARDLVPASNPFLQHFFDHIVGPNFDKRLGYIVTELCGVFSCTDIQALMSEYYKEVDLWGQVHEKPDPVIHFYEDFLKEYDPVQRKKLGAFYTPLPVVRYIIRAVDAILEKRFSLALGLADTSKIEITRREQGHKIQEEVHRVQILDPAAGTGTFLNETIRSIYSRFKDQAGRWGAYVHHDLLPRLHGFELMMSPYTIAHLKLSMTLKETGFQYFNNTRLGIYLTNSLEEGTAYDNLFTGLGFAKSIADEAKAAAKIKNDKPIMVVIGNPPYAGESSNKHYTGNNVYKVEPTGGNLQERNSKWLNDDYVKFIRLAESMVEKTGEGIVAMITAHGYLDNPTFRGMRHHLMKTFDEIYVLDLHGNANKKETAPDGSKDENVFAIKQGVAILIAVKPKGRRKDKLAKVFRADCFGIRSKKFSFLNENDLASMKWSPLVPSTPQYAWTVRDYQLERVYQNGFSVADLFRISSVGVVTSRDQFVIDTNKERLAKRIQGFLQSESVSKALANFGLRENKKWKAVDALKHEFDEDNIVPISYRPFDNRFVYYHEDFIERSRKKVMKHMGNDNIALIVVRQVKAGKSYQHVFVSYNIPESTLISNKTSEIDYVFPLYLYAEDGSKNSNLNRDIVKRIESVVGEVVPEDIFDYIYTFLYSPSYRDKYSQFLRTSFPCVPYPNDRKRFEALVKLGRELRLLHLMQSPLLDQLITTYPVHGSNIVEKLEYKKGNVYINKEQYFGNVPETAWKFWIGSYQSAQKWLKDRKGYKLSSDDLVHYQKIVKALVETDRLVEAIDHAIKD